MCVSGKRFVFVHVWRGGVLCARWNEIDLAKHDRILYHNYRMYKKKARYWCAYDTITY